MLVGCLHLVSVALPSLIHHHHDHPEPLLWPASMAHIQLHWSPQSTTWIWAFQLIVKKPLLTIGSFNTSRSKSAASLLERATAFSSVALEPREARPDQIGTPETFKDRLDSYSYNTAKYIPSYTPLPFVYPLSVQDWQIIEVAELPTRNEPPPSGSD